MEYVAVKIYNEMQTCLKDLLLVILYFDVNEGLDKQDHVLLQPKGVSVYYFGYDSKKLVQFNCFKIGLFCVFN